MYSLIVENDSGEWLQMTGNKNYDILNIEGACPPAANINTSPVVGMDGTLFNSARANQRNIVLTVAIHMPIESNRFNLYNFFRIKQLVTLKYKTQYRECYISGYVETVEVNAWSEVQTAQISIICTQPFWIANDDTVVRFSESIALFQFPFTIPSAGIEFSRRESLQSAILNTGEVEVGGVIEFIAKANGVKNPVFYNQTTQEYFGVNLTMQNGDSVIINTKYGEKSITLIRSGIASNILNDRKIGSTWLQFKPGMNILSFEAEEGQGDLEAILTIRQKYEGV